MLLVHHDQAEIGERQEQRRARARHHPHLALGHAAPDARPLLGRHGRVPFAGAAAEALLEPLQELAGERDFRQQDQHLRVALAQRLRHRLEIDLGLARAGDAVEQRRAEAAFLNALAKLGRRRRLLLRQPGLCEIRLWGGRARARQLGADQRTRLGQAVDHGGAHLGGIHQPLLGPHLAIGERGQNPLAGRCHTRWRRPAEPEAPARLLRLEHEPRTHHHLQHHALGRERIVRDPIGESEIDGRQRRHVQHRHDRFKLPGIERFRLARLPPDRADPLHRPQRHHHKRAGRNLPAIRHRVSIGLLKCQRQQHRHRLDGASVERRVPGRIQAEK